MDWIKLISAPLIGALIGYCTNYIAIKMLFRPYNPVMIGKFQVPFTPGIIPRRKPALAKAMGNMVGNSLVGEEEIKEILLSDAMKETVVDSILNGMNAIVEENTVKQIASLVMEEENYEEQKQKATVYIAGKIVEGLQEVDVKQMIVTEGMKAVQQMGGMVAMFVNESLIASLADPIGERVNAYMELEGRALALQKVAEEFAAVEGKTVPELVAAEEIHGCREIIETMYQKMIEQEAGQVVKAFDIPAVVEKKVNEMDIRELESMILSVMKHELGMIVNLGALIGFVLGLFNLMF